MTEFLLVLPADHAVNRSVRRLVRSWCDEHALRTATRDDVVLIVSELFTNAVAAAFDHTEITVSLSLRRSGAVRLIVINHGVEFDFSKLEAPLPRQPRGRGILIAQTLGTINFEHHLDITTITVNLL